MTDPRRQRVPYRSLLPFPGDPTAGTRYVIFSCIGKYPQLFLNIHLLLYDPFPVCSQHQSYTWPYLHQLISVPSSTLDTCSVSYKCQSPFWSHINFNSSKLEILLIRRCCHLQFFDFFHFFISFLALWYKKLVWDDFISYTRFLPTSYTYFPIARVSCTYILFSLVPTV